MLHELGDALAIDCGALVELSDAAETLTDGYHWSRSGRYASRQSFDVLALAPAVQHAREDGRPVVVSMERSTDGRAAAARAWLARHSLRSLGIVPVGLDEQPAAAWLLASVRADYDWSEAMIDHLEVLGDVITAALQRRREGPSRDMPRAAPSATRPAASVPPVDDLVGEAATFRSAVARLEQVANTDSTVLLLGETGTGKELFAKALHARGPRRGYPLVSVNCAALPPTLIESELFGHQRGAFTGAVAPRQGRFELAHRGTLFLDEIGDLPLDLQAKLLRVLQEGAFERVGSSQTQTVDVRVIAATHRDLPRAVAEGTFRADLYYRLSVFPIRLPPLRERREDIAALVWSIVRKRQKSFRRDVHIVPESVMETLRQHTWPGNVRELENVIERALIHSTGVTLALLDPPAVSDDPSTERGATLTSVERAHIQDVLQECGWRINGLGNAAERLGLHPNTLRFRMKKLGIVRREPVHPPRAIHSPAESRSRERAS